MKRFICLVGSIAIIASLLGANVFTYEAHALTEDALIEDALTEDAQTEEAEAALQDILAERSVMALVYLSDEYPVRAQASYDSEELVTVPSGQMVEIQGFSIDESYEVWNYVTFYFGTGTYQGYIPRSYLACSDERFLEWETEYGMEQGIYWPAYEAQANSVTGNDLLRSSISTFALDGRAGYLDIEQFPASYQAALTTLKEKHPNWTFVKMNTGLDWNTVIANEMLGGKSLVYKSLPDYTKEGLYDSGNWYYASEDILKLYMDPRNALTENAIFQFELLTYNETYHTEAAVETFLNNTFMNSSQNAPGTNMTFAHIFWAVGAEENRKVSPFHLAARVYQEQGSGTSGLISGTYPGYEGFYNYFNVGASGTTNAQVIENGLNYAKNHSWNNAYFSILGGADVISANYIKKGQDTLYLQKYNVNPNGYYALYSHQYMQNIGAPTSEAASIRNLYAKANSLENTFVFKIPVYENMPETACPMPTSSNNILLTMPEGYTDTTLYVDGVPLAAAVRNGKYIVTAPNNQAKSVVAYRYNEAGTPAGMYVWTLTYQNGCYTATAQPELENLFTHHGFSMRIVGKSGIRYKTGISMDLRGKLTTEGVNGYLLKEYGTLVMNNANRGTYPMIKGGEKVLSGMSYGWNAQGALEDNIFEMVDNRYRFASVLVGLPASQYKTEYAFRGYAVLEKDGTQTIIYGPTAAKSLYVLAQQVLAAGIYEQGSEPDAFLRKMIADADAVTVQAAQ